MEGGGALRRKKNIFTMDRSLNLSFGRGLNLPNETEVSEQNAGEEKGDQLIKSTFDLLERGEKEIKLDYKHKDVILVLGNTGSGKSTFTQWLAGDNTKLISKETRDNNGEFIIVDNNRISDVTLESKTIFPELVIEAKTNSAYYDCPGFSDTQGTSHDIAQTYFIKKVLDFSKSVKMVFVINHSSVRKGVHRQTFMKLVRHATDLVKDMAKFKNSIAIVATKVENQTIKKGKVYTLVEDKDIIATIADFLQEAKQYLEDSLKQNLSEKKNRFYENAIKFVEILLEKDSEQQSRIGIFRRPDEPGPVSEIELLQEGKQHIERIVYEKLNFTSKNNEDFGYTVSEKTKNEISGIVKEINKNLWYRLSNIAARVQEYYRDLVEQVRVKIKLCISEESAVDASSSEAETFRNKFNSGYNNISELIIKTKNLTNPEELGMIVNNTISNLDVGITEHEILYIANQGKYFTFLQTVSDEMLSSKHWDQVFKDVKRFFADSKTAISQDVYSASEKISNRMQSNLNDAVRSMHEKYIEMIMSLEIENLPKKLRRDSRSIFELTHKIENGTTAEKLVNSFIHVADNLGVSLPKQNLQNFGNQGKCLRFLEVISNETLVDRTTMWLSPFKNIAKYFYESEKWYTFLEDLFSKLSQYEIQKDRQSYNVADLDDWGQPNQPQGISVTSYTFEKFLNKIESYNLTEYQPVKNLTATGLQIEELNQVLSFTLKHRPTVRCSQTEIIIKGSFVVLSEIIHNLKSNADTNNSCDKYEENLGKGKRISVAIIAPTWRVEGNVWRTIDLSGANGTAHAVRKAKNGKLPGESGRNGTSGNPGVSGESFFGVGLSFDGGDWLKILSNGGKGGPGQAGGDGLPGLPGKDAPEPSVHDPECAKDKFREEFECHMLKTRVPNNFLVIRTYLIKGVPGGPGGNGGDGGSGGKGGDPGNINIIELGFPPNITKLTSKGNEGDIGKAGVGGRGNNGNDVETEFNIKERALCFFDCHSRYWTVLKVSKPIYQNLIGRNGTDGGNAADIKDPLPAKGYGRLPNILNEYKIYLRENINNRFQKLTLLQFLNLLNSKEDVRNLYDNLALIDEFKGLEKQIPKLGDQIDFSPFYGSLLERIGAFAEGQKDMQNESRKVLNYIYTAALGRIYNLRENSDQILIINMRAYLDMVVKNIQNLKDLQVINNKVDVINKYKENYKSGIDLKVDEAQSLIEKQINPEMKNINAEIDDQINTLIEETISLRKKSEKKWDELSKKKKELGNAMALKGFFNCLKIIGGVTSFFGPYGKILGTVINGATTVAEPLALKNEKKSLNIPSNVESSLKTLNENIKTMRAEKVGHLEKLLANVEEGIKANPETLKDLSKEIEAIKVKLKKVKNKKLGFKHVELLEIELEEKIKSKEVELKTVKSDKKIIDATNTIEKIAQGFKFGSLLSETYSKYKEDKDATDAITKSMEETAEQIKMLREYEKNIYDTIAPMLQKMEDKLEDISTKLGTKSHVALDVQKWQVQSYLKGMKLQMQTLTEGRRVKDDLSRSIEKLDEVMTTLVNVYDRIQSYQEQQNLANYIADVSSVAANSINIKDQQLANEVNHLEFAIRTNLVLQQYKSAIGALKQWVFPFADKYIEKPMLPSQLELESNLENLVQTATRQIEIIKHKLDVYDSSIMNGDQYLQCEVFNSRFISTQPFYVWENEENRKSISSLLSGKAVVLKADVKESAPDKDAIKFSEIEFDLKTKNKIAQSLLSEILKGFDLSATHLGNSYYIYDGKIFLITSDSVTISYSYEKDDDGIPVRSNEAYNRLKSGDFLLSPYTLWEVKMINKTNIYSFEDLEKYKNEINVELSGLGSYVLRSAIGMTENNTFENYTFENNTFENNTIENNTMLHVGAGLRECKRSKFRLVRSVNGIASDVDFMTSDASKGISSPITFLYNFLKTSFISNLVISINQAFFGEQTSVRKDCSKLPNECTETTNIGPTVVSNPAVTDKDENSAENDCTKERIEKKFYTIFDVSFNDKNSCLKSFLLSDQKYKSVNHSIQVPDLNCSLLLADLVTRTITRNKYQSPVDECLLSPRELMFGRIGDGPVQNEGDIKQMLQRHLSEKEVKRPSSWLSKLNGYAKSIID